MELMILPKQPSCLAADLLAKNRDGLARSVNQNTLTMQKDASSLKAADVGQTALYSNMILPSRKGNEL